MYPLLEYWQIRTKGEFEKVFFLAREETGVWEEFETERTVKTRVTNIPPHVQKMVLEVVDLASRMEVERDCRLFQINNHKEKLLKYGFSLGRLNDYTFFSSPTTPTRSTLIQIAAAIKADPSEVEWRRTFARFRVAYEGVGLKRTWLIDQLQTCSLTLRAWEQGRIPGKRRREKLIPWMKKVSNQMHKLKVTIDELHEAEEGME